MDLFEEIRDDIVKTKYTHLWNNYGKFAVIALILFVILLMIYFVRYEYVEKSNINNTNQLYKISQNNIKDYDQSFISMLDNFINNAPSNHKSYAVIKKINYQIANNNIASAYDLSFALYNDKSAYKPYKDFAELLLNYIVFKYPLEEKFDSKFISNVTAGNIFYYNILEIRALCYIEHGKISKARNELQKILNSVNPPENIKNFALELLNLLKSHSNFS